MYVEDVKFLFRSPFLIYIVLQILQKNDVDETNKVLNNILIVLALK